MVSVSPRTRELTDEANDRLAANATEEFFVRRRPLYEVVGQLGMWGVIINGVQASIIEHHKMKEVTWSGRNSMQTLPSYRIFTLMLGFSVGLLFGYTAGADVLTTLAAMH